MAPEQVARTRVFYDHESDEPRRRRHAVADWGVGEDIFDRMPSRRFTRADRRGEHHEEVAHDVVAVEAEPVHSAARHGVESWVDEGEPVRISADQRESDDEPRRPVESWLDAGESRMIVIERTAPDAADEPIVAELPARRTVVIKGHPERLPGVRPARPPRTAIERVGTSPDRIVAYAVALGFLLVLIAVLTTGQ
jgi:hypothetical protein